MKKNLSIFLFVVVFLISIASAVDFIPQGDINLKDVYSIKNGVNATFEYYCNATTCITISEMGAGAGVYSAGSNLTLTDTIFSLDVSGVLNWLNNIYQAVGDYLTTTEADNLYAGIEWDYNQTDPANDYTDSKLQTIFHNASVVLAVTGTEQGSVVGLRSYNDDSYNISEDGSDIDLRINFTGITTFNQLVYRYKTGTTETHRMKTQVYDYSSSSWEGYAIEGDHVDWGIFTYSVFDPDDHISDGVVQVRFTTTNVGASTHKWQYDWVTIIEGPATPSSSESDPFSIHDDGLISFTANWDQGAFNFTNTDSWWKGKVNYSDVQNHPVDADTTYTNGSAISLVDGQFNLTNCADNQIWKMDGSAWNCEADDAGAGAYTFSIDGDTGTAETIDTTNTVMIAGGTNGIDTVVSATDTITINIDISEMDTATPNDGDTTHLSTADHIYDWIIGLAYLVAGDIVGLVGNWSADKDDYSTTAEADVLYRAESWDNFTGIPVATPSDGDTTHLSTADQIYDWVIGLTYATTSWVTSNFVDITDLVSMVGNWSADKDDYSTTAEADNLYATIDEPLWSANLSAATGTGDVVLSDSPIFTTAITVPANSISDDEINEGDTFEWTAVHQWTAAVDFQGDVEFNDEIRPDNTLCDNGDILYKTGADNWDCKTVVEAGAEPVSQVHFDASTTINITCFDEACNWYTNATDSCMYWPSGGKDCGAA